MKTKLFDLLNPNRMNKQSQTVEHIAMIGHSCEAVGWRPIDYQLPKSFLSFMSQLDSELDAYLKEGKPDMYNARYYDELIDAKVQLALCELKKQRTEHQRSIHNIRIYQSANHADMTLHIRDLEAVLDKKEDHPNE